MTRLAELTGRLRTEGRKPVVPFLTAGYPDSETFDAVMGAAAAAGCPLVEIGIPFSDPVADGPVIQAASQKALAAGMSLEGTLEMAGRTARDHGLAVVLMGYLNPLLKMGPENFARACADQAVAGVIVPDLPLEEARGLRDILLAHGVELVDLVAPTTGDDRLTAHAEAAGGFLYLVSTTGVTGSGPAADDGLEAYVARVRRANPLPLYVGFGISEPAHAARVAACADGAVVGSALIRLIDEAGSKLRMEIDSLPQELDEADPADAADLAVQAAETLGAAVFVHPWDMMGRDEMPKYWLPWLVGMPAETSLSICSMIFGGIFERLPGLKVCFAHGGGAFPATLGRIEHGFKVRPDLCAVDNENNPRDYLGRFYVDALVHDADMLRYMIKLMGAETIAMGSDYPFPLGEQVPGELIESMDLPPEIMERLLSGTALEWLGLEGGRFA